MNWITCGVCEEEFRVITDSIDLVAFCPLCGSDLPEVPIDDEDSED